MWKPLRDENRLSILKSMDTPVTDWYEKRNARKLRLFLVHKPGNWNVKENSRHVKLLERNPVGGY